MANRTSEIAAEEVPGSPLRRSSRIATASPVPVAAAITGRRRSSASAEPTFPAAAKLTRTKRLSLSHETGDDRPSTPTKLTRARAGSKSPSQLEGEKAPGTPSKRTRRSSVSKIIEEEPEELSPTRSQPLRSTRSQSKSPERPKRGRPSMAGKQKKLEAIEETESKSKTEPKTPSTRGRRGSLSTRRGSTDIEAEDKTSKQIPETKKVTRRSTRATSVDLEEVEENKTKIDLKAIEEDIEHEIIEKEESSKNVRKKSLNANEDDKAKLNDTEKEGRRSLNKNQVKSPMGEKDETKISKNEDSAKTEKDETKISENEDSAKTPEEQLTLKIDEDNKPSNVEEVKSQSAAAEDTSVQISNQSQDSKSNTPIKAKLEQSKNMPKIEEQSAKNTPQKVNPTPIKSNLDGSKNSPKIGEQSSKNTSQTVNLTPIKSNLDESKNSPKVEEQSSKNTLQKVNVKSNLDASKNSPKVEEQRSENIPQKVNLTPIKPNLDQSPKIVEQSPKNLCNKLELTPKVLLNRNVVEKDFKKSITPTRNIQTDKIESSKSGSEKKRKLSLISTEENSKQLMPEVSGSLATTDLHSTSLKTQEFETTSPQILDETILDSNNDEKDSLQKSLEEDDANILKMCLKIESDKSNDEAHDKLDSKEMDEDATETNDESTKGVSDKEIENTTDLKHDKSLSEVETDFIAKKNSSSLQGDIKELNESQAVVNISKIVELDVSKTNSTKISDTNESREIIDDHNKSHEKVLNVSKNENIISKSETPLKKRKLSTSINEDNKNKSFKSPKTQTQKPDGSLLANECEMTCGSDGSFHLILSIPPSDNSQDTESDMKKEETLNSSTGSNSSDKENVNASPAKGIKPLKQINTSNTSTPKTDVLKSTSFSEKGGEIIVNPVVTTTDNVLRKSLSKSFDASRPEEKKKTDKDSDSIIETVAVDDDEQLNDLLDSFVDEVKDDENNESNLNIKEVKKTEEKLDNKVIELEEETTKQEKSFAKKRSDDENNKSNLNIKEVKKTEEKLDNKVIELEEETTKQEKSFAKKRSKRRKIVISEEEDDEISSDDEDVDEEEEQSFINLGDLSDSEDEEDNQSKNPFIDDQAFEGEEDTPSEDSNQIIERGESINSEDTDDESDDEDYENDSFIVDDDDLELLSSDEIDEFKKEKVKKKTRIIQVSDSDSEEDIPVLVVDSAEEEEKKINIIQDVKISAGKSKVVINEKDNSMNLEILKLDVDEESKKLKGTPTILQDYKRTRKASLTISDIDLSQLPEGMINEKITKAVDLICSTIKSSGNVSLNISIDYDNESNDGGKKEEAVVELQPEQSDKIDEVNQSQDKLNRKSMKRVSLSPSKAQSGHGDTMNISKVQPDEVEALNISELKGDTDKLKRRSKKRDSSALDTSSRVKSPTKARSAYDVSVTQEEADEDEILNITQSQADTAKLKRRSKKRDSGKFEKSLVRAISEDGILSQSVLEANEDKTKERSEKRDSLERRRSKSHSFYEENSSPNKRNDPETIDDEIDVKMTKSKLKKRDSLKNITHEDFKSDFEVEYVTSPLEKAKLKEALNNTEEFTGESPKENNTKKKSKRRQSTYFEMNEDEEPCSSTTVKGVNTFEVQNVSSPPKKSKSSKRMSLQDEFEIEDSKVEIVQQKKRKSDKFIDEIIPGKKSKKIKGELKPVEIKKNKSKKKKDKISPYTNLDYIPQTDFEVKVASPQKANVSEVKSKKMKHVSVKPSQVRQISGWEVEEADMARPSLKNEKKSEQQSYFEQISAKDFKNKMIFDPSRIKRTNAKKLLKSKAKMLMSNR